MIGDPRQPKDRLGQFLFWDLVVCIVSVFMLLGLYAFYRSTFLLVMTAEIVVYSVAVWWAWRQARRGNLAVGVSIVSVSILIIAVSMAVLDPEVSLIAMLLAVLAVTLGLPYIARVGFQRLAISVAIVAGAIAALGLSDGLSPIEGIPTWAMTTVIAIGAAMTCGLIFLLLSQYSNRLNSTITELSRTAEELEDSRRRLLRVHEAIRSGVAAELHGPIQNRLIVATHLLKLARESIQRGDEAGADKLGRAEEMVSEVTHGDVGELGRRLHPSVIRMSLIGALRALGDDLGKGVDIVVTAPDNGRGEELFRTGLPEELRLTIYRVTEEALENAVSHADARRVVVSLDAVESDAITLTIEDDGRGFDTEATAPGFGLLSMRDYCEAVDGSVTVESQPGRGTKVVGRFSA